MVIFNLNQFNFLFILINFKVTRSAVPGVEIVLQNVFIFASTLMFKFGRNEELWGN
jgi:hypothetical protein